MDHQISEYKLFARMRAKTYLLNKKHMHGAERVAYLKKCAKQKEQWKLSLSSLSQAERTAQLKAYRVFRRRKYLTARNIVLFILLLLVAALVLIYFQVLSCPFVQNLFSLIGGKLWIKSL